MYLLQILVNLDDISRKQLQMDAYAVPEDPVKAEQSRLEGKLQVSCILPLTFCSLKLKNNFLVWLELLSQIINLLLFTRTCSLKRTFKSVNFYAYVLDTWREAWPALTASRFGKWKIKRRYFRWWVYKSKGFNIVKWKFCPWLGLVYWCCLLEYIEFYSHYSLYNDFLPYYTFPLYIVRTRNRYFMYTHVD